MGHWVLCIVYVQSQELLLFDSLREMGGWASDVKVGTIKNLYLFAVAYC